MLLTEGRTNGVARYLYKRLPSYTRIVLWLCIRFETGWNEKSCNLNTAYMRSNLLSVSHIFFASPSFHGRLLSRNCRVNIIILGFLLVKWFIDILKTKLCIKLCSKTMVVLYNRFQTWRYHSHLLILPDRSDHYETKYN